MRNEMLKRSVGDVLQSVVADSVVRSELLIPRSVFLTSSTAYVVGVVATIACEAAARSAGNVTDIDGIAIYLSMVLWLRAYDGRYKVEEIERLKERHCEICYDKIGRPGWSGE
jgi:hypothetical protein